MSTLEIKDLRVSVAGLGCGGFSGTPRLFSWTHWGVAAPVVWGRVAWLALALAGVHILEIQIAMTERYWLDDAQAEGVRQSATA